MESRKLIGETISKIQKSKNIKIKDICKDFFSESTYFRIVNNEIETSIINFDHIIEKLNITYDEFFFLCNKQTLKIHETMLYDIKVAYLRNDNLELKNLKSKMEKVEQNSRIVHLQWLCELLIKRLENEHITFSENKLAQYLLSIEDWTRYEMVLFNNSIFSFNIKTVNLLAKNFVQNISFYNSYKKNNKELFQLLINVTACNIESFDYIRAKQYFILAREVFLEEDSIFEKTVLLFWTGFFEMYEDKRKGILKMENALNIFSLLGSKNLLNMHKSLYEFAFNDK
jgi:Rgg/GadR/MutR family transcriptional activator